MPEKRNWRERISRRRMIALTGTAGAGMLAGCMGDGEDPEDVIPTTDGDGGNQSDGTTPSDGNGSNEDLAETYEEDLHQVVPSGAVNPYDGEWIFNPYHTSWNPGDAQEMGYEYLAVYNTAEGEFLPRVGEEWSHEDGVSRATLSEDYAWSDGTPLTAEDLVTTYKLSIYMDQGISQFIDPDGVRADGDYAFELEPKSEFENVEESLWYNQWVETLINTPASHFGEYVERFEDASTEDEITSVQQDLVEYDPHWDESVFSGPFVYIEANEEYADQIPNQEHPIAQDFGFYQRHGVYEEEAGLRAGEVDYHHQSSTLQGLPDKYDSPPVSFSGQSFAILFGPGDEFVRDDRRVRQAIAHAVDFESMRDSTKPGTPVDEYSGGIDSGYIEHFVQEDVLSGMTNYVPRDTDRATTLLEEAGFSRDSGTWYTPNDSEWTLNFPVGNWFNTPSEIVANNLSEFGVSVDHYVDEMATWNAEVEQPLDYDISLHLNYGEARQYHAYPDLEAAYFGSTRGAINQVESVSEEVEVPEPGNPDGDSMTINVRDTLDQLSVAGSDEEVMELSTQLSWAHNQLLPGAQVFPWSEFYWVNAGEWNFDLETDDWLTSNRIAHYFLQNGLQPE